MRAIAVRLALVVLSGLGGGCGHARARPGPPTPSVTVSWPAPPAEARARLSLTVSVRRPEPARRWWRSALGWLTGTADRTAADLLVRPFDVAVADDGTFLIADPDAATVVRYAADGKFVAELTCAGGAWAAPMGIAAEGGEAFVADAGARAIVRWSEGGCRVFRPEGLERPTGIALHAGRVFVADPPAHRVLVLSRGGDVLGAWGERGEGPGRFNFPTDVASAPDGSIYVVDSLNFRIAHLAPDGSWLGAFGSPGEEGAAFERPKGVDVDEAGRIYVTDAQRDVALVFEPDGTLEYAIGASGEAPGYFAHPAGIAVRRHRVLVADSLNHRVQVFDLTGGTP